MSVQYSTQRSPVFGGALGYLHHNALSVNYLPCSHSSQGVFQTVKAVMEVVDFLTPLCLSKGFLEPSFTRTALSLPTQQMSLWL